VTFTLGGKAKLNAIKNVGTQTTSLCSEIVQVQKPYDCDYYYADSNQAEVNGANRH